MALLETLFEPYEKMKRSSQTEWTEQETGGLWVATEKVHGSNMTCLVDHEGNVAWARRNAMLKAEENFFGFRKRVGEPHGDKARRLFDLIVEAQHKAGDSRRVVAIAVCGELFGGSYPAPNVAPIPGIRPIQKQGVHYSPDLHFMAFDVLVYSEKEMKMEGESSSSCVDTDTGSTLPPQSEEPDPATHEVKLTNDVDREFLSHSTAVQLLEAAGFLAAHPLFTGTLHEVTSAPHQFPSTIPALLGLPPLPADTEYRNLAEGLVLKPDVSRRDGEGERVIAKKKIDEFGEKQYDAVPTPARENEAAHRAGNKKDHNNAVMERVLYELLACVTSQRLDNVLSKVGRLDWENKAQEREVLKLLVDDVFLDGVMGDRTMKAEYDGLEPAQQHSLRGRVQQSAKELMKQRFVEETTCKTTNGMENGTENGAEEDFVLAWD